MVCVCVCVCVCVTLCVYTAVATVVYKRNRGRKMDVDKGNEKGRRDFFVAFAVKCMCVHRYVCMRVCVRVCVCVYAHTRKCRLFQPRCRGEAGTTTKQDEATPVQQPSRRASPSPSTQRHDQG